MVGGIFSSDLVKTFNRILIPVVQIEVSCAEHLYPSSKDTISLTDCHLCSLHLFRDVEHKAEWAESTESEGGAEY